MPKIPFDDDDGRFEFAEPPELSEATKKAMARQQKLDDANFITERTLQFQNDMAAEFARAKRDGDSGDPMFVKDLMKVASEMRTEHLSDIPRGPRGRLISQDAVDLTRANMDGAMERFQTAALHRLNLERHQRAFTNIEAAGAEIAAAAKRDAKGLSGLLSTVDDLLGQYEGVFADDEFAEQRAALRLRTVVFAVDGLIERGATGDARELVTGGAADADLGPATARFLLGRIDMSEEDNAAKAAEEAAEARSAGVADLVVRVATGKVFPVELEVALAQGTIGPEEHADFLAKIERFKDDRARRIEGKERINELLARRQKPDETDRAAVDAVFEDIAEAIAGRPPEERAIIETRFVRRAGMLPAALRDSLIGGLLSEDPAAQVAAAGRFVAFEDADPVLIVNLPADTLTRARTITAFAYPGLPPARIVQLASEEVAQQGEEGKDREVEPIAPSGTPKQPATVGGGTQTQVSHAAGKAGAARGSAGNVKAPRDKDADVLFKKYRGNLRPREGKFVSHPRDLGGPTKEGFSQRLLDELRKKRPDLKLPKSTKNLTPRQIDRVFREEFFDKLRIKKVWDIPGMKREAPQLPEQLFDNGILHGITNAGQLLQQSLDDVLGTDLRVSDKKGNPVYDGNVGPATRAAIDRAVREGKIVDVNDRMVDRRLDFMKRQPKYKTFKGGWVPRAESFRITPKKP